MWLYRCLISLFACAVVFKALRGGGLAEASARLAIGDTRTETPHIWLHAASNGELASVRPVVAALVEQLPDLGFVVTTNTASGRDLAQGWGLPGVTVRLAPVDLAAVTMRFMKTWQIKAHITVEAEIWPNRLLKTPGPVVLLGARMSAGTAKSWSRFGALAAHVLEHVSIAVPQDTDSGRRLLALGLGATKLGPVVDLKGLYTAPGTVPKSAFARAHTWLAASTHAGDEAQVLRAHELARQYEPGLQLILAPRHPARGDVVATMIRDAGFSLARRSRNEAPGAADVFLADSLGEMPTWYAASGRVFIGGTWTDRGGHTPYEPAAFGAALLHGPDTRNFKAAFGRLRAAGAAHEVADAEALSDALVALGDADTQSIAGQKAQAALVQDIDLDGLVRRVKAALVRR